MPSFIYSPEIRVHVAADGTNLPDFQGNIYDISDDLVQGSLIIRTNGVHTFNFQLQNTQRKYDGVFQPMDRITVEMKRVTWVRVFSGYLNNGPIFSAWPRVLNMSASCTLKRLQFWFWDPGTIAAYNLVTAALSDHKSPNPASGGGVQVSPIGNDPNVRLVVGDNPTGSPTQPNSTLPGNVRGASGQPPPTPPANPAAPPANPSTTGQPGSKDAPGQAAATNQLFDDSIKGTVLKLLNDVVGWPQEKVHIGDIPKDWVKLATEVGNLIMQKTDERDMLGDFSQGDQSSGGAGGVGTDNPNGPIPPGNVLDWCKAGLALAGLPQEWAAGLAQQAMHESSGNPHIIQTVDDINMRSGNPAKGLLQMIPSTFMAWAVPGHTDIFNPIDNAASASRYANNKFGPAWFSTGPQHNKGF